MKVGLIIPAYNEEESIGQVVRRCMNLASQPGTGRVVVCDNDSSDSTAEVARAAGAEVVHAAPRGYGIACQRGIQHLGSWPDVLVFIDADGSSRPEEIDRLLKPIRCSGADLVIGRRPPDSPMTPPQRWGTRFAVWTLNWRWGSTFTDIGPFRAIRRISLEKLKMRDRTWGWTIEMQILAILNGLKVEEAPVSWEKRLAGRSKISGTVSGVLRAGARILWTIGRYGFRLTTDCSQ
ncbi:MAG: glycosyltransferase family 2 protein [Acidobacteriota bacterium]